MVLRARHWALTTVEQCSLLPPLLLVWWWWSCLCFCVDLLLRSASSDVWLTWGDVPLPLRVQWFICSQCSFSRVSACVTQYSNIMVFGSSSSGGWLTWQRDSYGGVITWLYVFRELFYCLRMYSMCISLLIMNEQWWAAVTTIFNKHSLWEEGRRLGGLIRRRGVENTCVWCGISLCHILLT